LRALKKGEKGHGKHRPSSGWTFRRDFYKKMGVQKRLTGLGKKSATGRGGPGGVAQQW